MKAPAGSLRLGLPGIITTTIIIVKKKEHVELAESCLSNRASGSPLPFHAIGVLDKIK